LKEPIPAEKRWSFPECGAGGWIKIELITAEGYHAVSIRFEGRITLHLVIDPGFTLKANLRDWKDGNGRSLKSWPPIVSAGMRLR
jgi:hypothetical protein